MQIPITKLFFASVFSAICSLQTAYSQYNMTVQECVDYALKNNLQIKQNELNIANAQANFEQSKLSVYPNVNGSTNGGLNMGRSIDPFTNTFTTQQVFSNSFSLNVSMDVYNGMQNRYTIKRNEATLEANKLALESNKNDIMLGVVNAYLQILFNQELLNTAKNSLSNVEAQVERTQKLIDAGVMAKSAIFDLLSQKATAELTVVQRENAIVLAYLNLKQFMQMNADEKMQVVVPALPEPSLDQTLPSSSSIYASAEMTQPQIKNADMNIKVSEHNVSIARSNLYPSVSLSANLTTGYSSQSKSQVPGSETTIAVPIGYIPSTSIYVFQDYTYSEYKRTAYFTQLDQNFRQFVGFSVTVPIFNRLQVRNSITTSTNQVEIAKLNAQNTRNQLRQTIEKAHTDVLNAQKTYASNKKRVEALEETFRITKEKMELGNSTSIDFALANANLLNAKNDLIIAKYDYFFKLKVLDFYQGKPISF